MPINAIDRNHIYNFVNNPNNNNLSNLMNQTEGGPCANFVYALIEAATQLHIINPNDVFNRDINHIAQAQLIPDYNTYLNSVDNGDILYVVQESGDTMHYMVYCVIQPTGHGCCLGVNGGFNLTSQPYKQVIASHINANNFENGLFLYDGNIPYLLYKVDYNLVDM